MTGVLASILGHAVVLILLSLIVLRSKDRALFETEVRISERLSVGVTNTIVADEASLSQPDVTLTERLAPEDSVFVPPAAGELVPQGLDDSGGDSSGGSGSELLTGVDAAVADIQKRVERAGGKSGEVQFSLSWKDRNDLDLHVITPKGDRVHFHQRRSPCGGHLDVDMNVQPESDEPVENVRWPKGKGNSGRYTIYVNFYNRHARGRVAPFELVAKLGDDVKYVSADVRVGKQLRIYRYIHIRPTVKGRRRELLREKFQKLQQEEEQIASKLLEEATANRPFDLNKLGKIAYGYPHTDAALKALRLLPDKPQK